jgi:hypothetical protein
MAGRLAARGSGGKTSLAGDLAAPPGFEGVISIGPDAFQKWQTSMAANSSILWTNRNRSALEIDGLGIPAMGKLNGSLPCSPCAIHRQIKLTNRRWR